MMAQRQNGCSQAVGGGALEYLVLALVLQMLALNCLCQVGLGKIGAAAVADMAIWAGRH